MWLNIFVVITFLLFILYATIILLYRKWFIALQPFKVSADLQPQTSFSIIIPARNEEDNIANCLLSILQQNYPSHLYEVIVVDDHSTDKTPIIIQQLQQQYTNLQLIKLTDILKEKQLNSYKKKAIELAVKSSKNDWIVTTDADCLVTENWLKVYAAYIQKNDPVFVGAAVAFTNDGSVLQSFQCIDFMALQGITAAAVSAGFHAMCNGANLAYKKSVFYEVDGFKGIDNIASGDDMLLMNKIKTRYPKKIGFAYNEEAIVKTTPMETWKSFFNQRIRWASKANAYKDRSVFWVLLLIYLLNVALLLLPILSIFNVASLACWLLFLVLKTWVEASFAFKIAAFFKIEFRWWHPLLQVPHIIYTVVAGWLGMFGQYQWKGRQVK